MSVRAWYGGSHVVVRVNDGGVYDVVGPFDDPHEATKWATAHNVGRFAISLVFEPDEAATDHEPTGGTRIVDHT